MRNAQAKAEPEDADRSILAGLLYILATIQFVWYYMSNVPSYLHISLYEQGCERTPFQGRLLMMLVLHWAHRNGELIYLAKVLTAATPIFNSVVQPESIVQAVLNTVGVAIAGWVATRIYQRSSSQGLMTAFVYPLVLIMCVMCYILHAMANFRFFYDLPSLGLFSLGLYLIYFRKSAILFSALFIVATINRETTLFLLFFFALEEMAEDGRLNYKKMYTARTVWVLLPLCIYWIAWHIFVGRLYAHNYREWIRHYAVNATMLVWVPAWPQLFGACAYVVPLIVLYRCYIKDATLRAWLWILPAWFGVMFIYGIIYETRIYGELIPYLACTALLIAEEVFLAQLKQRKWSALEDRTYFDATRGRSVSNSLSESSCTR